MIKSNVILWFLISLYINLFIFIFQFNIYFSLLCDDNDDNMNLLYDIKIVSFNIRTSNSNDPCPCGCWEKRKYKLLKEINDLHADFIGTQETSELQKNDLDALLKNNKLNPSLIYSSIGKSSKRNNMYSCEINAIYYSITKWKVLKQNTLWLSDTPFIPSNTWGNTFYRTIVYGRFEFIRNNNISICIINTHFPLSNEINAQIKSSNYIINNIYNMCDSNKDSLIIITADLNTNPSSSNIKRFFETNNNILLNLSIKQGTWCYDMIQKECSNNQYNYIFYYLPSIINKQNNILAFKSAQIHRRSYEKCYNSDHAVVESIFTMNLDNQNQSYYINTSDSLENEDKEKLLIRKNENDNYKLDNDTISSPNAQKRSSHETQFNIGIIMITISSFFFFIFSILMLLFIRKRLYREKILKIETLEIDHSFDNSFDNDQKENTNLFKNNLNQYNKPNMTRFNLENNILEDAVISNNNKNIIIPSCLPSTDGNRENGMIQMNNGYKTDDTDSFFFCLSSSFSYSSHKDPSKDPSYSSPLRLNNNNINKNNNYLISAQNITTESEEDEFYFTG